MPPSLTIHDAHGWTQQDRRRLLLAMAQLHIDAARARGLAVTWEELPEGIRVQEAGRAAWTVTYAELAAGEARIDAGGMP